MLFLIIFIVVVQTTFATVVNKCGNGTMPIAVRLQGCDIPPCKFVKGTSIVLEIDFGVDVDVSKLNTKVKAFTMGMSTDYPLPQGDACLGLINGECPLDAGEEVTYELQMPILPEFPKVSVVIEFSVVSELGVTIFCFSVAGQVVDPTTKLDLISSI